MPGVWRQQIDGLAAQADEIDAALPAIDAVDPAWTARLQPIVHKEVERIRTRLARLAGGDANWAALHETARQLARLADETLLLIGGVGARSSNVDQRLCELADRLLVAVGRDILVTYNPITIPAAGEFIDVLSEVIRVRFPGSIWDAPIVLHEFAHFLQDRVGDGAVAAELAAEQAANRSARHAQELWADVFATYIAGPSYAFALVSRVNVAALAQPTVTHPSPVQRWLAVTRTLTSLQAAFVATGHNAGSLQPMAELAHQCWDVCSAMAGPPPALEAAEQQAVLRLTEHFIDILDDAAAVVRFDDAGRSVAAYLALREMDCRPAAGANLIDVLNGAWWARAEVEAGLRPDLVPDLANAVWAMCEAVP